MSGSGNNSLQSPPIGSSYHPSIFLFSNSNRRILMSEQHSQKNQQQHHSKPSGSSSPSLLSSSASGVIFKNKSFNYWSRVNSNYANTVSSTPSLLNHYHQNDHLHQQSSQHYQQQVFHENYLTRHHLPTQNSKRMREMRDDQMNVSVSVSNATNSTSPDDLKSRIFIGNLNTSLITKRHLHIIFSTYGEIKAISMHKGMFTLSCVSYYISSHLHTCRICIYSVFR